MTISRKQARQFLLQKQLLLTPQSLNGKKGIEEVFQTLRILQYDPLNPCGRNIDLVLQSRVNNIHPDDYYDWLYIKRQGIECYDKELCIIPIEDFIFTTHQREKIKKHSRMEPFMKTHERELEELLEIIDKKGPVCSHDIADKRRVDVYWAEQQWGRAALEVLWKVGRLVIVKRVGGKKYYDLPQKAYGKSYNAESEAAKKITEEHILRRVNSVGMLPKTGTGSGWLGVGTGKEIVPLINTLLKQNKLIEIHVETTKQTYIIAPEDKDILEKISRKRIKKKVVFIAPLDNLLWDRQMIENFFDFIYRWEVYTPEKKRLYGYYVLPILYGDQIIGRIEPVLTKKKELLIKGFWQEKKELWNEETWNAFSVAIETFQKYLKAERIINIPQQT